MKEDPSQENALKEWTDLFSDPASSLFPLGKETHAESAYPTSLHLALWLEFFLVAGEEAIKEKWAFLPLKEQTDLGIELFKCYLFQPLYIRLFKGTRLSTIKAPLKLAAQGKFFRIEHGSETNLKIELLYPLNHRRFWPDLFRLIPEDFFSSQKIHNALEPGIFLASSSRLGKIRQRAETLGSFLWKEKNKEIFTDLFPEEPSIIEKALEDTPRQVQEEIDSPEPMQTNQPMPEVSDLPPSPLPPPRRKKKNKTSMDQMKLF